MKRFIWLAIGLVIVAVGVGIVVVRRPVIKPVGNNGMEISSSAFANNAVIPRQYGCAGEGVNPPLGFSGVPPAAKELALVVDDPDAPGGTFDHWVLWNLPVDLHGVPENWEPGGGAVVGANGAGKDSWYPPCPPSGTHHYHFKLYALNGELGLAAGSDKAALEKAMQGHMLAQAELVGTYSK